MGGKDLSIMSYSLDPLEFVSWQSPPEILNRTFASKIEARRACGLVYESSTFSSIFGRKGFIWRCPWWMRAGVFSLFRFSLLKNKVPKPGFMTDGRHGGMLFVHIPKCGGISIRQRLLGESHGYHRTIADYSIALGAKALARRWKFTFVRNPFSRIASAFFYLKRGGRAEIDAVVNERILGRCRTLEDFILMLEQNPELLSLLHFRPQWLFLINPVSFCIEMDFVGRIENLDTDLARVFAHLGMSGRPTERRNVNPSGSDYSQMYSSRMVDIVGGLYKHDLEIFRYQFA